MAKKGEKILTIKRVMKLGFEKLSVITTDILDGFTSIGDYAFEDCYNLTSIEIPNSISSIGYAAFRNCSRLTTVTINNGVTKIGDNAFEWCTGLTSVSIPNSITSIGWGAFLHCHRLTSVFIPNNVTYIGYWSFWDCSSLTPITIGDKTYEKQVITNGKCKAYKAFNADMTCRDFHYKEGETYEIEDTPKLCKNGFHACLNFTDIFNYYFGEIGKDIVIHEVELEDVSDERRDDSKVVAKKISIGKRIL